MNSRDTTETDFVVPIVVGNDRSNKDIRPFQTEMSQRRKPTKASTESAKMDIQTRLEHANSVGHDLTRSVVQRQVEPELEDENSLMQPNSTMRQLEDRPAHEVGAAITTRVMAKRDENSAQKFQLEPPSLSNSSVKPAQYRLLDEKHDLSLDSGEVKDSLKYTLRDYIENEMTHSMMQQEITDSFIGAAPYLSAQSSSKKIDRDSNSNKTSEADFTTLLEAISKVPEIKLGIEVLRTSFKKQASHGWRQQSRTEKFISVSSLAVIGGGTLTAILKDPTARMFTLDKLSGVKIPLPCRRFDWLKIELSIVSKSQWKVHMTIGGKF